MKQSSWTITYQRIEGAAIVVAALFFYFFLDFPFAWLILLILSIDVFMLGYIVNKKLGAHIYNIGHMLLIPTAILIISLLFNVEWLLMLSLIWIAHVGLDRFFGYGLKHQHGFKHTHLGKIGK